MHIRTFNSNVLDLSKSDRFKEHYNNRATFAHIILDQINNQMYDSLLTGEEKVIIDIGGNVGLFSIWASDVAEKIYSIEPTKNHTDTFKELVSVLGINNIDVFKAAITDVTKEFELFTNSNNTTMNSLVFSDHSTGSIGSVQGYGLNDFLLINNIESVDFIKMDIEGSEMKVIPSEQFKIAVPKIKKIFVEVHDFETPNGINLSRNTDSIQKILTDYGFKTTRLSVDGVLGEINE